MLGAPGPAAAVTLLLVSVLALMPVFVPAAAWAQAEDTGEAEAPSPPTTVSRERTLQERAVVDAAIRLYRVRAELVDVEHRVVDTAAQLAIAEEALARTEQELAAAQAELADVRSALQARAAHVYQRHSDKLGMILSVDRVIDLSSGNRYASSIAVVDNQEIARLEALVAELERRRAEQRAIRDELAAQKAVLEEQRAALQAAVEREQAAVDRLGGVPVMGASVLSAEEMAAWFKARGHRSRLMGGMSIDELTRIYLEEGTAENVRADLAFAQAVLETGSFGNATDNNFAGIGACDSCDSQFLFPTPRDGVRAQIQLLRNYADPFSRAHLLANPPDATLHGRDPVRAAYLFDSFSYKGRAPVWNVMGAGNWATDPFYAGKVLEIYAQMLSFVRSAGPEAR